MRPRHAPPFLQGPSSRNIAGVEIADIKTHEHVRDPFKLYPDLLLLQGLDDADYVFGRRGRFQLELAELRVYLGVVIEQLCLKSRFRF